LSPVGCTKNDTFTTLGSDLDWFSLGASGYGPAFFDGHSPPAIDVLPEFLLLWRFAYWFVSRYYWSLSLRAGKSEVKSRGVANRVG
jgi:hypothetical protein